MKNLHIDIPDCYIDAGNNHEGKACEQYEKSQLATLLQILVVLQSNCCLFEHCSFKGNFLNLKSGLQGLAKAANHQPVADEVQTPEHANKQEWDTVASTLYNIDDAKSYCNQVTMKEHPEQFDWS